MSHEHIPNAAGTACASCGLRATRVSADELERTLNRELRRRLEVRLLTRRQLS